jgi:hypothetical protein
MLVGSLAGFPARSPIGLLVALPNGPDSLSNRSIRPFGDGLPTSLLAGSYVRLLVGSPVSWLVRSPVGLLVSFTSYRVALRLTVRIAAAGSLVGSHARMLVGSPVGSPVG